MQLPWLLSGLLLIDPSCAPIQTHAPLFIGTAHWSERTQVIINVITSVNMPVCGFSLPFVTIISPPVSLLRYIYDSLGVNENFDKFCQQYRLTNDLYWFNNDSFMLPFVHEGHYAPGTTIVIRKDSINAYGHTTNVTLIPPILENVYVEGYGQQRFLKGRFIINEQLFILQGISQSLFIDKDQITINQSSATAISSMDIEKPAYDPTGPGFVLWRTIEKDFSIPFWTRYQEPSIKSNQVRITLSPLVIRLINCNQNCTFIINLNTTIYVPVANPKYYNFIKVRSITTCTIPPHR